MAVPLAIIAGGGAIFSGISQSNALRSQAAARKEQGRQELELTSRQFRQEAGVQAVQAGASGLLTSSFTDVFDSQAILDAEALSSIRQSTEFDVEALRRESKGTLIGGVLQGATAIGGGVATKKAQATARRQALKATPGGRLRGEGGAFFREGPIGTRLL